MSLGWVGAGLRTVAWSWLRLPVPLRALVPIGLMVALWASSSVTPAPRPSSVVRDFLHNGAHIVAYGVLAGSFLLCGSVATLAGSAGRQRWRWPLCSIGLAIGYGIVDELHQARVPGRVCSYGDLLSDASGATLAVVALLALLRADVRLALSLAWCLLACLASVSIATWVPW